MIAKIRIALVILVVCAFVLIMYFFLKSSKDLVPGYVSTNVRYISSQESGRLIDLNIKEGQAFKKGQTLFSLDSSKNETLLKSNEFLHRAAAAMLGNLSKGKRQPYLEKTTADIQSAEANLEFAEQEYHRQAKMFEGDSTSRKEYQQSKARLIQAQNQVKALEMMQNINNLPAREGLLAAVNFITLFIDSNSSYIKDKISSAKVKASEDGYVYQTFYNKGEEVRAYAPVISIINPKDVYIVFYVSRDNLAKVNMGKKINIILNGDKSIEASISYISQKAEYTPPLLYGINSDSEISFEVKAKIKYSPQKADIHIGEPVKVELL